MGVCNCSMFCCTLLYVNSSFAIILIGNRELVVLLSLSSWCLGMVVWLFLTVPWVCLWFAIAVFPDHTHLLFLLCINLRKFIAALLALTRVISERLFLSNNGPRRRHLCNTETFLF